MLLVVADPTDGIGMGPVINWLLFICISRLAGQQYSFLGFAQHTVPVVALQDTGALLLKPALFRHYIIYISSLLQSLYFNLLLKIK